MLIARKDKLKSYAFSTREAPIRYGRFFSVCARDIYCAGVLIGVAGFCIAVPIRFAVFTGLICGLLALTVLHLILRSRLGVIRDTLLTGAPIYAIALWAFASTFWSIDSDRTLRAAGVLVGFVGLAFLSQCVREEKKKAMVVSAAVMWSLVAVLFSAYLLLRFGTLRGSREMVDATSGQWGNRLSNICAVTVPLLWYGLVSGGLRRRTFMLCMLCCTLVVGASVSRGGIAAFLAANLGSALLFLATRYRQRRRTVESVILTGVVVAGVVGLLFVLSDLPNELIARLAETDISVFRGGEAAQAGDFVRRRQYAVGWELVLNPTLSGIGYDAFLSYMAQREPVSTTAHNILFIAVGELGVIGGALLLWTVLAGCRSVWQKGKGGKGFDRLLYYYLAIALVVGLVAFFWRPQQDNPMLWVQLGVLFGRR